MISINQIIHNKNGTRSFEEKIKEILQKSCNDEKDMPLNSNDCIPFQNECFSMATGPSSFSAPDDNDRVSESLSIIEASSVEAVPITREESKVHVRHYPYCAVGTLFAYFPDNKDIVYHSTCFLIEANVVVTLASNLYNIDQGGKATSVTTSFSNEKVTTIMFPDNFEKNKLSGSNLAVLLYSNQVVSDWLGVKIASQEELSDKDILVMASLGPKDESNKSVLSGDSLSQNDSSSCRSKCKYYFNRRNNKYTPGREQDCYKVY